MTDTISEVAVPIDISQTRAALEAAVLDLTDEQIVDALTKVDVEVRRTRRERERHTWPQEASRNLLAALALRMERGRVRPKSA
jgi:hypothetical protein